MRNAEFGIEFAKMWEKSKAMFNESGYTVFAWLLKRKPVGLHA